jgi:glycerophosphoryl diester phosphodiesterase
MTGFVRLDQAKSMSKPTLPKVIGHRGAAKAAPENTLESIREAKRQGATWVEIDAKLTSDNKVILLHDDLLDRTTSGKGAAAKTSLVQFRALDAGSWFAPSFAGIKVPTLEETVKEVLGLGLSLNVEIKPCPGREHVTAELVTRELQRLWPKQERGPAALISSFAYDALKVAHQLAPEFPRAVLIEDTPANWKELCAGVEAVGLNPWHKTLTPEWTRAIKQEGLAIATYTVNDPARARELFGWGVDTVFSDAPGLLLKEAV